MQMEGEIFWFSPTLREESPAASCSHIPILPYARFGGPCGTFSNIAATGCIRQDWRATLQNVGLQCIAMSVRHVHLTVHRRPGGYRSFYFE